MTSPRIWILALPVLLVSVSLLGAPAPTLVPGNLIQNPSFENPRASYDWTQNNWAKNDVAFALDPVDPHSGKVSQRITLRRALAKPDLQFQYRKLPVHGGMNLQLRFWTRGPANTKPITVTVGKGGIPYTAYFTADVALKDTWTESVFNFPLPPNADPKDTNLMFELKEENTCWLDDVSLTELPAQAGGQPRLGSQLANGSFEVGTEHWYCQFRESGNIANSVAAEESNIAADIRSESDATAPEGSRSLGLEVFPSCRANLTSAYFPLRYGYPTTIRFWLKAPKAGVPFKVVLGQGKFPNVIKQEQSFTSPSDGWNFYRMLATPQISSTSTYYLEFALDKPGPYRLDAVSVVEGDVQDRTFPGGKWDLGWENKSDTPSGHLFYQGDPVAFLLRARTPAPAKHLRVHLRLVDDQERELKKWTASIPIEGTEGAAEIPLPSDRFGGFKVEVRLDTDAPTRVPRAGLIYSVVERLNPPGEVADSFFGGHVYFTPYNLALARRIGFRWLRTHPPLMTKWESVERTPGQFHFDTRGVARARGLGFQILGSFDTTPPNYADAPPKNQDTNYPPKDWAAWERYVTRTAEAFSPYIWNWEIWNEPDGGFLQVKPGVDKAAVYAQIVQHVHHAIDSTGLHEFLVGNVAATLDRPFTLQELNDGGGKEVDALSFHFYNEDRGVEEKEPPLEPQLEAMRKYLNRSGLVPPIWCTEGGIWLDGGPSWLGSARIPTPYLTTIDDAANSTVRTAVALKAIGVRRYFTYAAYAQPSGGLVYRNECDEFIDVDGIPKPTGAAFAAAVHFLEGAEPVGGLQTRPIAGGHVAFAKFQKAGATTTVIWARGAASLGNVSGIDWKDAAGFDLMGNPITLSTETPVGLDPIYLVGKTGAVTGAQ
jgi:hypothetical protein